MQPYMVCFPCIYASCLAGCEHTLQPARRFA